MTPSADQRKLHEERGCSALDELLLLHGDTVLCNLFSVYHPSGCKMKYKKTILLHMTFIRLSDIYLKVHPRNCVYLFLFTQKMNLCKLQWIYLKSRSNRSPVIFRTQPDAGVLNQTSFSLYFFLIVNSFASSRAPDPGEEKLADPPALPPQRLWHLQGRVAPPTHPSRGSVYHLDDEMIANICQSITVLHEGLTCEPPTCSQWKLHQFLK